MAKRNNIRSFRYSDTVAEALEQQDGSSLNDKFETLVLSCVQAVPEKKKELKSLEKCISKKQEEYRKACTQLSELEGLLRTLNTLKYYGDLASGQSGKVKKQLEEMELV